MSLTYVLCICHVQELKCVKADLQEAQYWEVYQCIVTFEVLPECIWSLF